jgi:hypothetical protein
MLKTAKTASQVSKIKDIEFAVRKGFTQGVTAKMEGAKRYSGTQDYLKKAADASGDIVKNKDTLSLTNEAGEIITGRVPQSLREAAQAVEQRMTSVFEKFNALQEQATGQGVRIPLAPIAKELRDKASSNVMQKEAPEVARYALEKAKRYEPQQVYPGNKGWKTEQFYTPKEMQEAVKQFNNSLDAYYSNKTYDAARRVDVDAVIVRNMRKALDDAISNATGAEYQELKNLYGAHKTIEQDIVKKFNAEARRTGGKGLIDATDIYSVGEILTGLATLHPLMVAKGTFFGAAKKIMQSYWSPDNKVKKMFQKLDEAVNDTKAGTSVGKAVAMTAGPAAEAGRVPLDDEELQERMKKWLEENK